MIDNEWEFASDLQKRVSARHPVCERFGVIVNSPYKAVYVRLETDNEDFIRFAYIIGDGQKEEELQRAEFLICAQIDAYFATKGHSI